MSISLQTDFVYQPFAWSFCDAPSMVSESTLVERSFINLSNGVSHSQQKHRSKGHVVLAFVHAKFPCQSFMRQTCMHDSIWHAPNVPPRYKLYREFSHRALLPNTVLNDMRARVHLSMCGKKFSSAICSAVVA
jgi:hypothetical protein